MSVVSVSDEVAVKRIDPLFRMAVVNGIRAVIEMNIRKGVDLNTRDDRGVTVLMLAAVKGNRAVCQMLLDAGANPDLRDRDGRDAADYATLSMRTDAYMAIAEAKARRGADDARPVARVSDFATITRGSSEPSDEAYATPEVLVQTTQNETFREIEQLSGFSSSWEAYPEPTRPKQDVDALCSAATDSFDISLNRARTDAADWSETRIDLPIVSGRISFAWEPLLDPLLRRRLASVLLQGIRTGLVHPSRISAAVSDYPGSALLATALTAALEDLGAETDEAFPDLWSGVGGPVPEERQAIEQALESISLQVSEGTDEIGRLRVELDRWALLSREDETIYGRQIQDGFKDVLSIAARTETVLTRIIHDCEEAIAGRLPASAVLDVGDDVFGDPEDDEKQPASTVGGDAEAPELPEPLRLLSVRLEALKEAFAAMKGANGSRNDPIMARNIASLLATFGFATAYLRTLSMLEPAEWRDARLVHEYRGALKRMDYARERMVLSNMKLVIWQAKKYRTTSMTLADLVHEGTLGLMKAASKFDPFRGFRFATPALWWIRQAITRAIADNERTIRLPVHVHEHHYKLQRRLKNGEAFGSFTKDQISEDLKISPRLADSILGVFFDAESVGGMDDVARHVLAVEDDVPYQYLEAKELRNEILSLLSELEPRQRDILNRRFGLVDGHDQTLEEIGQIYGVTRERIRQIEAKALRQLAHPVRSRRLAAFLR